MKSILILIPVFGTVMAFAHNSNSHFSHTDSTTASPEQIWQVWTDVSSWHLWDKGLKSADLEGAFVSGAKGKLVPDRGPISTFLVYEVIPQQSYAFKTRIPLGWIKVKRTLFVREGRTYYTHDVEFTGILKGLFGQLMGKKYRAMLPGVLTEIKKMAET